MATHLEHEQDQSVDMRTLVSGIVQDGQELLRQHLQLFQAELTNDLRRTANASMVLGFGAIVGLMGVLLLMVSVALLVHFMWPQTIPLWAAMGIVGGGLCVVGIALVFIAKAKFASFNPLPDKTLNALKESFSWKAKTT